MIHSRLIQISPALLVSACMAGSTGVDERNASSIEETGSDQVTASAGATVVHMLPLHHTDGVTAGATGSCSRVMYFGGPLLTHVEVHPVFWNSAVALRPHLDAFYSAMVTSPLFAMLSMYSTGFGGAVPGVVDTRPSGTVTDSMVQTELNTLISAGILPLPTANTYYPVHFPKGMTIKAPDGSESCVQFCAYHSTFVRDGVNVNYGIIPDMGSGGCATGCSIGSVTTNTDVVSSHELAEAVTDPAVGLAVTFGPPLGWIDPTTGDEIGDLCNFVLGSSAGFAVQKEWSNAVCGCVDH